MNDFIVPLSSIDATEAARVGPKAANVAALGRAGLPVPDGYCLTAAAYHAQIAELGLADTGREVFSGEDAQARRAALKMRMTLMDQPLAPAVAPRSPS